MKFIKYSNLQFADVLRGAQFDRNVYNRMLDLKSLGKTSDIGTALNMLKGKGVSNAIPVSGNKVVFLYHLIYDLIMIGVVTILWLSGTKENLIK